ncbi:MAG: hypothetical protein IPM57_11015 [Oligoflexia bacterium]|nr:hypothetical protein [Oligoflexia bacterium]
MRIFLVSLVLLLSQIAIASPDQKSFDYAKMFDLTRQALIGRPQIKKFLKEAFEELLIVDENLQKQYGFKEKIKDLSESQFILLLSHYPELWPTIELYLKKVPAEVDTDNEKQAILRQKFREELKAFFEDKDVVEKMAKINNPTEAVILNTKDGSPGILEQEIYFNHESFYKGKKLPPTDLSELWVKALDNTKKEYMINSFEFDLDNVANAAIRAKERGVDGIIGVDKNMVEGPEARQSVKDVVARMKKAGVNITYVDPTGLNHQKFGVFDWSLPEVATVVASSGNLTKSCSGPQGDLTGLELKNQKDSIWGNPNANHTVVTKSPILAVVAHHTLYKTLVMKLRGVQDNLEAKTFGYPLSGAFQIMSKEGWVIFTTTPGGSIGNPNKDMFSRMLWHARDFTPTIIAFALSSSDIEDVLYQVAEYKKQNGKDFIVNAVADKPFALANWSVFLKILGLKVNETSRMIEKDEESRWRKLLGDDGIKKLEKSLFVGPAFYKEKQVELIDGTKVKAAAKIHHKVLQAGPYSSAGSSFNNSNAATSNQEQVFVWKSQYFSDRILGALEGLKRHTRTTIKRMAEIKNGYLTEYVEKANCPKTLKKVSGF